MIAKHRRMTARLQLTHLDWRYACMTCRYRLLSRNHNLHIHAKTGITQQHCHYLRLEVFWGVFAQMIGMKRWSPRGRDLLKDYLVHTLQKETRARNEPHNKTHDKASQIVRTLRKSKESRDPLERRNNTG
jgi:hypothetical protein